MCKFYFSAYGLIKQLQIHKIMQYSAGIYVGIRSEKIIVRQRLWIMARSTPITPAAARIGESHIRFWMMALSLSAALSNCGLFSWLDSEPRSLCPVGLGRNWYYFLQTHKKHLSQTIVRWSEMPSSTALPSPSMLPIPYPSYVDLLYPSPTQAQTVQASAFASSIGRRRS
jgi:hypothetical protein